ncbi:GreA/GreB family elongation factor [Flavisphingomonas formosensis]|uniref:GreA/GreB family elongation factor n=1 Tax=Flavisphingomonas formosensis TaxID=861534 RepID=UPI0012FCEDFA|nr:GreA/GreB family elongation factor [Sphingomonas formosensis]
MSVAFRRESDDEHKEPKFEIPIPPGPNLVTERGLTLLQQRVAALESEIAAETKDEARDSLKRDLRYWITRLATAQIAPAPAEGEVGIGSHVRIRLGGAVREVSIVGGDEADPATSRIAFSAPLARALMGAAEGDRVDFNGTSEAIEVLNVENELL